MIEIALGLLGLLIGGLFLLPGSNFLRWPREPRQLTPNCLLTKAPVVFVTGARSPFYFRNYWNSLPLFLSAHGYEVRVLRLPWTDVEKRRQWMRRLLANQPCHLVIDRVTGQEISDTLKELPVRSLYVPRAESPLPAFWNLIQHVHSLWLRRKGATDVSNFRELGLGDPRTAIELLRFVRHAAEREWMDALASTSENPVEESSKA